MLTKEEAILEANSMTKEQIIDHYKNYYSLSFEEYEEMEEMSIADLRQMFVEGESM